MDTTFEKLRQLQDILSRKIEIEKEIKEIPKALSTKQELLSRLQKSFIEKNDQKTAAEERIKQLRNSMADAERSREESEKRMDEISTQREYEALEKEIKDATEKEQQLRRDIQREDRALQELSDIISDEADLISQQEEEIAQEKERISHVIAEKEVSLDELKKEESVIVPGMDSEILFKFERIIRNKSGLGIVPVKRGVCTGCHMILPAQFVNDVRLGEGILFCPYCSRILFYEQVEEDTSFYEVNEDEVGGLADLIDIDFDDE